MSFYVCGICNATHTDDFFDFCENCKPVDFVCSNCNAQSILPFQQVCNVCFQLDVPMFCNDCAVNWPKIFFCNGCDYPVCENHTEFVKILRKIENKNTVEEDCLHLCTGFQDENVCWRGFMRRNLCDEKYKNVYFDRDTVRRELPELCLTRKWAERQKKITI